MSQNISQQQAAACIGMLLWFSRWEETSPYISLCYRHDLMLTYLVNYNSQGSPSRVQWQSHNGELHSLYRLPTRVVWKVPHLAYVKLGTSGIWIGYRIGAGVTATLRVWESFFGRSPWLHWHWRQHTGKVKSSRPSLQPMWNSGQGKDPDRSWCHRHTSVKLSWSQPMYPWTERYHTRMLRPMSMEPWAASTKALN